MASLQLRFYHPTNQPQQPISSIAFIDIPNPNDHRGVFIRIFAPFKKIKFKHVSIK